MGEDAQKTINCFFFNFQSFFKEIFNSFFLYLFNLYYFFLHLFNLYYILIILYSHRLKFDPFLMFGLIYKSQVFSFFF